MTQEELLKELASTLFTEKVRTLSYKIRNNKLAIHDLLAYCYNPKKQLAFRAAWVLEYTVFSFAQSFLSVLNDFLAGYIIQKNLSCQRHYTKIIIYLTKHNSLSIFQFKVRDFNFEPIIDTTFEWLINPKTPIAVKVNCIEILVNLRSKSDWIEEELKAQIKFLLKDGGPAVQSRGRKMLKVLGFEMVSW